MDVSKLVDNAKAGDIDAFTILVQRYQAMAFGYAYATTRDFDLAEDAAQQAFITAWTNLSGLNDSGRFGGWLRGIVRFECLHLLRSRKAPHLPIDSILDLAADGPVPAEAAEDREALDRVLAAINTLPDAERIATILFYIHDHSQKDVAGFLNIPVTTVNNRLRNARKHLRQGELIAMTRQALESHPLPNDFADRIGKVVRSSGPIVEARFNVGERPPVLNQVAITGASGGPAFTAQVAQYLSDDLVRCIVTTDPGTGPSNPQAGWTVRDLAESASHPLDLTAIGHVIEGIQTTSTAPESIETGIKVIDLTCPLATGGLIALIGDMQVGKMVLVEELIHRLSHLEKPLTLLVFVETTTEVAAIQKLEYRTSGAVNAIYLPVTDASSDQLAPILDRFDAVISLSRELGRQQFYPAVDPLRSSSRLLDPALASEAHVTAIRDLHTQLRSPSKPDRTGRIRRYLTQPFYVAEAFTNRPGASVSRNTALADLRALLDGAGDTLSLDSLLMTGALADIPPTA
jgi:RNA polymerase sigma factor (sigma-70 family)